MSIISIQRHFRNYQNAGLPDQRNKSLIDLMIVDLVSKIVSELLVYFRDSRTPSIVELGHGTPCYYRKRD